MLYMSGIASRHKYAGIASVISVNSMLVTVDTIRKPTKIRAGAVAKLGIEQKIGDSTTEIRNKNPVTTEERPVLAPAATPEELSTNVVVVEVPSTAPGGCNRIRQQRFLDARQLAVLVQHVRFICHTD